MARARGSGDEGHGARRMALGLLALAALGLGACASRPAALSAADGPRYGDAWRDAPGAIVLDDLRLPGDVRDLALTLYPTAHRADYGSVLLPLDGALWVDETSPEADEVLRASGLDEAFRDAPPEAYALAVLRRDGRTVVATLAQDEPGRRWASLAAEQITVEHRGRRYVRACRVIDAPVFPLRGNKRPQAWERRYRANFAWEAKERPEFDARETVATFAPGSPLDATPAAAERLLARWRPWQEKGVRRFCVKFDDVGFEMTPATAERYGSYPVALTTFVASVHAGLRDSDPDAVLYLLPQTYWWNDPRLGPFARALHAAGGLDDDVGLVVTGPEVISETIDAAGLAAVCDLFGAVRTPALIYDNLGREGDWGPLTGRDPALAALCDGVFGERGTPVNRLTRLDWLWNPGDYDPERSWRRAILELAGVKGYAALRDACDAFRRGAARDDAARRVERFAASPAHDGPVPAKRIAAELRRDLVRLGDAPGAASADGTSP